MRFRFEERFMSITTPRGAMGTYQCKCCGSDFLARTADRARGWARFCSKRCKAVKQERRTGQHAERQQRKEGREHTDDGFTVGGQCFPSHAEGDVQ